MDSLSPIRRSANMSRIRSRDTKPELLVRQLLHRLGYRYRLHRRDLPGIPDLVFPSRRKVIFVHGCFWHQHKRCVDGRPPKSRLEYWLPKLRRNVDRDRENMAKLRISGWTVLKLWECDILNGNKLEQRLLQFLGPAGRLSGPTQLR